MAITKVKLYMANGDRLEVQQLDASFSPLPIAIIDLAETIDIMTTDTVAVRIASFQRSCVVYWSSDLATVAPV